MKPKMDRTRVPLELLPLDQFQAVAPAPSAPLEIEILPVGKLKHVETASADKPDRFVKEAAKQYEEGHIDQPLWDRALVQANNDKEAATAVYLRARATALRLLDRDRRAGRRPPPATPQIPPGFGDTVAPAMTARSVNKRAWLPGMIAEHRKFMIPAGAVVFLGVCVWLLISYLGSTSPIETAVARSSPDSVQPAARSPAVMAATKTAVGDTGARPGATQEFMNKIQELSEAGNWNVLVLYAVEWTRREPENAAAWNQLREGYVNMRQYGDALDAATKAVQLAPENARMWRNLGQVNMDLNDPSEALRAFDKALALSPEDATALCLRKSVAPLAGPQKDPKATAALLKSFDSKCLGLTEPVAQR